MMLPTIRRAISQTLNERIESNLLARGLHGCPWLLWLALLVIPHVTYGYFETLPVGVRGMGLGGASVALATDATAPFSNPAGLARLHRREFQSSYALLHGGLDAQLFDGRRDSFGRHLIGYAHPAFGGTLGFAWHFLNTQLYDEHTFVLSRAERLHPRWLLGIDVRLLYARIAETPYTALDPDLAGRDLSITTWTFDIGSQFEVTDRFWLGMQLANLRPARVGLLGDERLPISGTVGIAYRLGRCSLLADLRWQDGASAQFYGGAEMWLLGDRLALRMGVADEWVSFGWSLRHRLWGWDGQIDYASQYPTNGLEGTFGTNHLGLVMRF